MILRSHEQTGSNIYVIFLKDLKSFAVKLHDSNNGLIDQSRVELFYEMKFF